MRGLMRSAGPARGGRMAGLLCPFRMYGMDGLPRLGSGGWFERYAAGAERLRPLGRRAARWRPTRA